MLHGIRAILYTYLFHTHRHQNHTYKHHKHCIALYALLYFSLLPLLVHFFNGIHSVMLFLSNSPPFVECIMLTLTLNKVQLVHHVKKFICSSVNSTSVQFFSPDFFSSFYTIQFFVESKSRWKELFFLQNFTFKKSWDFFQWIGKTWYKYR